MATTSPSHLRSCSLTNRGRSRGVDQFRKTPSLDSGWPKKARANSLRRTGSDIHYQDRPSRRDFRAIESKSSDESVVVEEKVNFTGNSAVNGQQECTNRLSHANSAVKYRNGAIVRHPRRYNHDYPELNIREALTAMQKLQRLKEVQRRRDLMDKYYSQEIRKLIGDYYFTPRMALPASKEFYAVGNPQPSYLNRSKSTHNKALEPCGTMTTITRLDCGCVQETTRPIFTTARGRVEKKNCSQSQNEIVMKLTSSNPQEHLYSSAELHKATNNPSKLKKRLSLDSRFLPKIPGDASCDIQNYGSRNVEKSDTPIRTSKNVSPTRKISDTSTVSL